MTARRFCFLTTFYPPWNFGGDGVAVRRLAHGLVRRGHHVTVVHDADAYSVLHPAPPSETVLPEPPGLELVRLQTRTPLLATFLTHQTGRPVANGSRLRALLAAGRFDVINFHNISLIGGPGLLAYGSGAKIYFAHEHWLVCPTHALWRHNRERCETQQCLRCQLRYHRPPQLWRYTGLMERQLRHVDVFVAMSEFSRDKHRELGFPREMDVLPYFVPDDVSPDAAAVPPHPRPYFLFVGRLEAMKGLDDVVDVFATYDQADLLIVGDGPQAPELRRRAAGNPRIRFLGHLATERIAPYYRHATALIVPSHCFETFGITIIEAFEQGTPVIGRRIGPFPEIVERFGGGELFDTRDQLEAAMRRLVGCAGRREQMSRAATEAFRAHWCEAAVLPRYLAIVDKADERRRRRQA